MINDNISIQEDAKSEWMKLVRKHKKRQKGLPALSQLNTNAGDVEHNINVFNMVSSAADGSCGDSVSMGESIEITEASSTTDKVYLDYANLHVDDMPTGRTFPSENTYYGWTAPEDETEDVVIPWTYSVYKDDIVEFLQDLDEVQNMFPDNEDYTAVVEEHFDELLDKFYTQVLDNFEDEAIEDARENYDYEQGMISNYLPDRYLDESKNSENFNDVDDIFDMSMRTLL